MIDKELEQNSIYVLAKNESQNVMHCSGSSLPAEVLSYLVTPNENDKFSKTSAGDIIKEGIENG